MHAKVSETVLEAGEVVGGYGCAEGSEVRYDVRMAIGYIRAA